MNKHSRIHIIYEGDSPLESALSSIRLFEVSYGSIRIIFFFLFGGTSPVAGSLFRHFLPMAPLFPGFSSAFSRSWILWCWETRSAPCLNFVCFSNVLCLPFHFCFSADNPSFCFTFDLDISSNQKICLNLALPLDYLLSSKLAKRHVIRAILFSFQHRYITSSRLFNGSYGRVKRQHSVILVSNPPYFNSTNYTVKK